MTPDSGTYALSPEQAAAFADESSAAFVGGGFQVALGAAADVERIHNAFLTGEGMGWHEHGPDVFEGCRRFFEPGYRANLRSSWIPALDGVHERLQAGGRIADIGCGHGASAMIMAEGYPKSVVSGFDYHQDSIAHAQRRADEASLSDRLRFEVARADGFPGSEFDLIMCLDCLHDIPSALSQGGKLPLGAQAGEARLRETLTAGGFTRVRRAAETPFNLVLEARP
jgi:SAM-dependent methyltransferase